MTSTAPRAAIRRAPAAPADPAELDFRSNTRAAGLLYLLTFAASIPALLLLDPILNDPNYIVGAGRDPQVLLACLLDFVNALACIGTAVAVFPIVRRVNESLALGFVLSRMMEAAVIVTGVVALLTVVLLRQDYAGSTVVDSSSLILTGQALVTGRDWTFLFGPMIMAPINALLFGTLLFRSGLVPRIIPTIGLIGAPILLAANLFTFFGYNTQASLWTALGTVPIAVWELAVGLYMTIKGFKAVAG